MDADHNIYDYFGGQEDLANKKLRFIGLASDRIQEDYLRILRYFRFAVRYDMINTNDFDTLGMIKTNLGGLKKISRERIAMEVQKIAEASRTSDIWHFMNLIHVTDAIFGKGLSINDFKDFGDDFTLTLFSLGVSPEWMYEFRMPHREIGKVHTLENIKRVWDETGCGFQLAFSFPREMLFHAMKFYRIPVYSFDLEVPPRPFNGLDVRIDFPHLVGKEIGERLKLFTDIWCASGFKLNYQEVKSHARERHNFLHTKE